MRTALYSFVFDAFSAQISLRNLRKLDRYAEGSLAPEDAIQGASPMSAEPLPTADVIGLTKVAPFSRRAS
ncbi:hypothetical protein JQ629_20910 [Bradyrhizobium sp. AUGA SZCCT0222]|nr:hypothetical protein [Bradyrhizobium sp. AUGA SZCCT0222]MBR1269979.1 hypothetical protein [Bradyrhizobium sp. AUGA SZCCT0222]